MQTWLNVDQTPEELQDVYARDFYWYLDSPEFHDTFLRPIGSMVNEVGAPCLDVGCGAGQLSDHVTVPYVGIDGSARAIGNARRLRPETSNRVFHIARMENYVDGCHYGSLVFGGILEVLIKAEHRADFLEQYVRRFSPSQIVVYDLERLDTSLIDRRFKRVSELHLSVMIDNLMDVKKHRKILRYEC